MPHFKAGLSCVQLTRLFIASFLSVVPWGVLADLPVHATIKDIKGQWVFFLTPQLPGVIQTCGSGSPNRNTENLRPEVADRNIYLKTHGGVESTLSLWLTDDLVDFSQCRNVPKHSHRSKWKMLAVKNGEGEVTACWTTVYDEGFEVLFPGGKRLMAILKYDKSPNCPAAKDGDLEDSNGRTACYKTNPGKTQLGWSTEVSPEGNVVSGCFFAEKSDASIERKEFSFVVVRDRASDRRQAISASEGAGLSYYLSKEFVDKHNGRMDSTWKAVYDSSFIQQHQTVLSSLVKDFGYSKVNSDDGREAVPSFLQGEGVLEGRTQLFACPCKAGEAVQDSRSREDTPTPVLSPVSMLQSTTISMDVKEHQHDNLPKNGVEVSAPQTTSLPKEFAWRNPFTDPSFSEPVTNQGNCGSCYAIAGVYALEKRFDIALSRMRGGEAHTFGGASTQQGESFLENSNRRLSPQSVVACSFHNQGCHGGFPYLVGKHAAEVGVLEDKCMPYIGVDDMGCPTLNTTRDSAGGSTSSSFLLATSRPDSCNSEASRWFAKDYGYVGGCYEHGNCSSEEMIMAEIYNNGPVVAAFDSPPSLFSYSSGIYDTEGAPHARVCDNPGESGKPNGLNGWEFTNHAVSLVGWGETDARDGSPPQKFWIVRNSWGPSWGNKGYFLLAKGKNAGGIESQVSFIDPDFSRGMGRQVLGEMRSQIGDYVQGQL